MSLRRRLPASLDFLNETEKERLVQMVPDALQYYGNVQEDIAAEFPNLSPAQVEEAILWFCFGNGSRLSANATGSVPDDQRVLSQ